MKLSFKAVKTKKLKVKTEFSEPRGEVSPKCVLSTWWVLKEKFYLKKNNRIECAQDIR